MWSDQSGDDLFLLSLRWPNVVRNLVVSREFDLGSHASSDVWVPTEVLAETALAGKSTIVEVVGDDAELDLVVHRARHGAEWTSGELTLSIARLPDELRIGHTGALRGSSIALRRLLRDLRLASASDASVLIQGDTGTGKELIARTLHEASPRRGKPYVVIDCTAISETLFESELFGHVKGAFSGANNHRVGPFEEANGGTVLIDEIGEIPLSMQPKLLRVLESGTVRRVGENTHRNVDVRVIGATHRDLRQMVQEGKFRADLYYRLAVLELRSPPLRDRHGDLRDLLRSYVSEEMFSRLDDEQWEAIETHPWRGNVRELRNFAEKAATHGWSALFRGERTDERPPVREEVPRAEPAVPKPTAERGDRVDTRAARENGPRDGETLAAFRARWVHEGEAKYLRAVLSSTSGSVTRAARIAGVDRSHFHRILRRHGLAKSHEREGDET